MSRTAADALSQARRLVLKVGSALLVDWDTGRVNEARLTALGEDIARLSGEGRQLLVVSSGAVALGRRRLGLGSGSLTLDQRQAAAAAGQSLLMRAWEQALEPQGLVAAQILLTRDDTETRRRWLNARATVQALLGLGAVPIINENDTVATEEIRYGDNDRLAARVAQMAGADLLILLSDVDGLYTADPRRDPAATRLDHVPALTPEIEAMAGGANVQSGVGSGGMATKIAAARIAGAAGCATVIADGRSDGSPLARLTQGGTGTLIAASSQMRAAYKQWIGGSITADGALIVDPGCASALKDGRSLLAAGMRSVTGAFYKGDAVRVLDEAGQELAVGLSRYDAADARRIAGLRSAELEAALGWPGGAVVIHADDLALRS